MGGPLAALPVAGIASREVGYGGDVRLAVGSRPRSRASPSRPARGTRSARKATAAASRFSRSWASVRLRPHQADRRARL